MPVWVMDRSETVFLSSSIARYVVKGIFYRINDVSVALRKREKE